MAKRTRTFVLYVLGVALSAAFWIVMLLHRAHKILFLGAGGACMLALLYLLWAFLYGRLDDIRSSRIVAYLKKRVWFLALLLLAAAFVAFISYPGIWYFDSYERVKLAFSMEEIVENAIYGFGTKYYNAFSPMASFMMSLGLAFTGNIGFYTMMQAFFFMLAISVFIDCVTPQPIQKYLGLLLFLANPAIFCAATYYEAGVGCLTGMIFLIVSLTHSDFSNSFDQYLQFIVMTLSCVIIFGYRINAFTIVPVIVIAVFVLYRKNRKKAISVLISFLIGFLAIPGFSSWLNITTTMSSSEAFIWEMITAIKTMPEDQKVDYSSYLDDIFGDGATRKAMDASNNMNICSTQAVLGTVRDPEQGKALQKRVLKKYCAYALANKQHFIATKWDFISGMMGIKQPLLLLEWDYDRDGQMNLYHFNDSDVRHAYYDSYPHAVENRFLLRPWLVFLITLILVTFHHKGRADTPASIIKIEWISYFVAVFYYGAFLVNTQSMEFRYFYPACTLLLLTGFSASSNLVCLYLKRLRKKTFQQSEPC